LHMIARNSFELEGDVWPLLLHGAKELPPKRVARMFASYNENTFYFRHSVHLSGFCLGIILAFSLWSF
jgi:hypothetical protein